MQRRGRRASRSRRRVQIQRLMAAGAVALAVVAAGCGSSSHPAASSTTSGAPATTAAPSGTGGAGSAQPGVTPTSVTVGTVTTISGPIPGVFQGAADGVSAYFAYINSMGGVDGRQLKTVTLDDGLQCSRNQQQYANNMHKVFAFVGGLSVFDNCGAKALTANPGVSSVAYELTPEAEALQNQFDPEFEPTGAQLGPFEWYKQHYPNNLKVGGLYSATSGAEISWNAQIAAMKSLGYKLVYSRGTQPTETSFVSDVLRMKSAGVNFLWLTDVDINTLARVINEAAQQNWHPLIVSGDTLYDPNLPKLLADNAGNGILNNQLGAMYLGEDRSSVPAVDTFLTWMKKTHPGFQPDLYSMMSWSGAALFVEALKAAGPNPTRPALLAALKNIHSFNADGLLATNDPGGHKPSSCYIIMKYQDRTWSRVTPASGFQCQPGGYFYYKGK